MLQLSVNVSARLTIGAGLLGRIGRRRRLVGRVDPELLLALAQLRELQLRLLELGPASLEQDGEFLVAKNREPENTQVLNFSKSLGQHLASDP